MAEGSPISDGRERAGDPAGRPGGDTGTASIPERGEPSVQVLPDGDAGAATIARLLAEALATAATRRGRADFASTGGSTPPGVYRVLLAEPLRSRVPWEVLHVWLGDDRFVPRHDPLSNLGAIDHLLLPGDPERGLAPAPLDPGHVHPWPIDAALGTGEGPAWAAARFEEFLRAGIRADAQGRPVFDAVLVGIGPDGHLLSVFPGSSAFEVPGWTTWVPAPTHIEPHVKRVTLTPPALDAAPVLVVAAFGGAKATIVAELLGDRYAPVAARGAGERQLPALRARRRGATWVLDASAAAGLTEDDPRRAG